MIEATQVIPLWSLWWVWMAAALLLAIAEVVLPGFLALGFAIAAAIIGFFLIFAPTALGLPALLAICAILALITWLILRRFFRLENGQVRRVRGDINKN
ncbi:NfeD family protein [Roseovarius sp. S4756]|uniref:NfeD family protein n=1 Tax=Roseovarius maritimus TaxID=3342637 RepID=UPI00372B7095